MFNNQSIDMNNFLYSKRKIIICIFFLFSLFYANKTFSQQSQNTEITIRLNEVGVKDIFEEISKKTNYTFLYNETSLTNIDNKINLNVKEKSLSNILNSINEQTGLRFQVSGKSVSVASPANRTRSASSESRTISGTITDDYTGESLIGVNVYKKGTTKGTVSNIYGFYSLTLPKGLHEITFSYIGYKSVIKNIDLNQNLIMNIKLSESQTYLDEVVITAEKKDENITNINMGVEKINMQEMKKIPVILGERDVLKTIQLRPGVKASSEGSGGFFVRGGKADQNLIMLDEATVYNAYHLFGFFSTFNSDAISNVTLYKGSQPAEYGGRLSSVLDIRMKEGNTNKFGVEGGIGLIASRLKIEGPIVRGKGSFVISGRRTYADVFLLLSSDSFTQESSVYFYDLNAKANYRINDNNRIFLSGYFGRDNLGLGDLFGFDWGNTTGTLRWNHIVNKKLFSNTSVIYSDYNYDMSFSFGTSDYLIRSRIQDFNLKQDFQYFLNTKNEFKFGFNSVYHVIIPGEITIDSDSSSSELNLDNNHGWENALYFSHKCKLNKSLNFEYGLRLSSYSIIGPGDFYKYDDNEEIIDSVSYSSSEFGETFYNLEPRIGINYILNEKSSLKASYGRNTQNLHLISNSVSLSPTDLWIPNSLNVKPEIADQIGLGYFRNFKANNYEFSTELYYKFLQNQIDYKDGVDLKSQENIESQLLYGEGRAYGIEFYLRKKYGKLSGWIGYSLARTEKKIKGINNGDYYPARQDRTHDVSIVALFELSKKWTISANWVYYTGNAVTFPSGKYEMLGQVITYYTERNGYRMPAYHRLDIGATWYRKKTKRIESSWNFSIYNVYGWENAYYIRFETNPDDPTRSQAIQTSLFRWVPSFTYNFKF